MKELNENEVKLCQLQANLFEISVNSCKYSSAIFIRRFMMSRIVKSFDNQNYLNMTMDAYDVINALNEEYGKSTYGTKKFTENEMHWIGYIYRAIAILYELSSKEVYKLFKANDIVKYYNTFHTFDIIYAADRMMELIGYNNVDYMYEGTKLLKRLRYLDKAKALLNKQVEVIVDRQIGSKHNDVIYPINYGYVKYFKSLDGEYVDAYILGENKPLNSFIGTVIAIIHRLNDNEDKLIISNNSTPYTKDEIKEICNFQEKYFKIEIIM